MNRLIQKKQEFLEWLRNIEKKWQSIWREKRIFEPQVDYSRRKYFITVPYPYANGPLHIGHGRTYTIGDIIARYKRLQGYNVLYPMAFHITGTPIIAFSEMISRRDPQTLSLYREYIKLYVEDDNDVEKILESFKDPLNLAVFFANNIQRDFEELGYSIDWRRKFHTGEQIYNRFVEWQYYKLLEKNLITKGDHIVTYCLLHQQPEGEDDIRDADTNPVEILEYTAIKFKLTNTEEYLLAATLRPETILGVTNIWVHPEEEYVLFEWKNEKYIASKSALLKLTYQYPEYEFRVVESIKGSELIGKWAESPLGDKVLILPAWFIDPDNATGIVYSEPSDAPYDYVALLELKNNPHLLKQYNIPIELLVSIEPRKIIHVEGIEGHHAKILVEKLGITLQNDQRLEEITQEIYREQYYNGILIVDDPELKNMPVKDAREKMKIKLYTSNQAIPFYELNRKAWCRSGGEIIVAKIKGQWFLDYNVQWLKEQAKKVLEVDEIEIVPKKYKKAFSDTIDWLDKRPCARKRGIGTKLPWSSEWIIESLSDSTIYMAFYTIIHILRENNIPPESLKPEVFDYVFLGIGDPKEVSALSNIPLEVLEKMRKEFTYWYPVDHRHTATPHISNHLSFYILHHIAIFPEKYVPRIISLNESVIREGAKMSKSKGNVIPLKHISTKYSADLFRLYISWAANLDSVLDWREAEVNNVIESLVKFASLAKNAAEVTCSDQQDDIFTKWFINKFYEQTMHAVKSMENLEIRDYVQTIFFDTLTLIDKYRNRVKDKYICGVRRILRDWITLLNPIIPHITEEINSWLGSTDILSTSKLPELKPVEEELVTLVESIENTIIDAKELISLVKKKPSRVYIIIAPEWKREIGRLVLDNAELKDIINTMRLKYALKSREIEIVDTFHSYKRTNKSVLEKISKTKSKREYETYIEAIHYIKSRIGDVDEVVVLWEDEARAKNVSKAERALPLKPAIYIE